MAYNRPLDDLTLSWLDTCMTSTAEPVAYEIRVYVMRTWPTGSPRGTGFRTFTVSEEASILGGMRAIDRAVEQCNGLAMVDVHSPEITPNPALEGWPVSLQAGS